jgi:hypothetical protein
MHEESGAQRQNHWLLETTHAPRNCQQATLINSTTTARFWELTYATLVKQLLCNERLRTHRPFLFGCFCNYVAIMIAAVALNRPQQHLLLLLH